MEIIKLPKFINGNMEWKNNPTNSSFFIASFIMYDEKGQSITGLTFDLEYRRGLVASECNYKFTIRQLRGRRPLRAYQIEVYPAHRNSHSEGTLKFFGPHQHIGEKYESINNTDHLGCADHEEWFKEFIKRANIAFAGSYFPPDPQGGQLDLGI